MVNSLECRRVILLPVVIGHSDDSKDEDFIPGGAGSTGRRNKRLPSAVSATGSQRVCVADDIDASGDIVEEDAPGQLPSVSRYFVYLGCVKVSY